ncbi:MAG: hypothetical protein CMK92_03315 [Pseudomonas sp.]|nr:hypothetical protein [Pseudomonas sp.]
MQHQFRIGLFTLALCFTLFVSGCSHERSNRMVKGFNGSAWVDPGKPLEADKEESATTENSVLATEASVLEKVTEQARKQHGLMHIHRYGAGYDILLTLDAGDSDVRFIMELPEDPSAQPKNDSAEAMAAEAHSDAQQRLDEAQVDRIQRVERMTKHVLSAQGQFYKKEYWQALDEIDAALELVPDSAQAHALKGSIYFRMGLEAEARNSWQQALALDPELEQVKASLARLPQ